MQRSISALSSVPTVGQLGQRAAAVLLAADAAAMAGNDSSHNGGGGGGDGHGELPSANEEFEALSLGVLFTTMLIFLGGTFFMTHRKRIPLPYTVVLFLYGIFVGAIAKLIAPGVASALGEIPPELLFYIFLPVLIFEGSFAMNVHALRRVFFQTLILATVGILINTAILGCAVKLVYMQWSWYAALLLGSLLSATDPVAVVSLLKNLRVEKHITAMVDGEAVMNDGTAIIVFTLLLPAAKSGSMTDPVWLIILNCVRLSVLPVFIGPAFGFLQSFWLRRAKDGLTRACVTVSVTYVSYYVAAHWIGASGVLTLFFQGIFLSHYCPSLFPGVEGGNLISSTWEFLVHIGNTMLFSLVGVILVADVVPTIEAVDILIIVGLYIAMTVARLVMFEVLLPVMNLFSFKMTQKTVLLLTHAGLRGGVAATLALAVRQGGVKEGIPILKITCGVVLLTLLINATTSAYVVSALGFKSKEEYRVRQMQYAMDSLYKTEEMALERVKRDTKYRNASWLLVEKYVSKWLRNPFTGMEILLDTDDDAMINRLLMTDFKTALWRQRDEQVISETVVMELGQLLAGKIASGELFNISEMQLYHRGGSGGGGGGVYSGGGQASDVAVVDATTSSRVATANVTGTTSPRALSVVVDTHHQRHRSGRGYGATAHDREEELPTSVGSGAGGSPLVASLGGAAASPSIGTSITRQSSLGNAGTVRGGTAAAAAVLPHSSSHVVIESPISLATPGSPSGTFGEDDADVMVEALMGRLLPTWVVLAERFLFRKGYFVSAHRRAQENAFMSLLAVVKCLTVMSSSKYQYVQTPEQARRVEAWFTRQLQDGNAAIRFFYNNFPEATNTVSSSRAVISIVNELQEAAELLHAEHGVGMRMKELLEGMTDDIRENMPERWENNAPQKESELVTQAVGATALGKGLRRSEVRAIATMALVKNFHEYDIITLPENAFLIVVFGSLRALHSRWTTISRHEWTESYGDTVGLETFLIPRDLCKDRQRQWQVISSEATAVMISFNSIKPFLYERSLRAVKALWRAAAVEVVLPFLESMIAPPAGKAENAREVLTDIVMQGTPLIGPEDCTRFDFGSQFHLCFYLRGSDATGMFNGHTPPCYVSAFYANQLVWRDPEVVLYAVPMNISDSGYVPWNIRRGPSAAAAAEDDDVSGRDSEGDTSPAPAGAGADGASDVQRVHKRRPPHDKHHSHNHHRQPHAHNGGSHTAAAGEVSPEAADAAAAAAGSTYADAESILNSILQGIVPSEFERSRRGWSSRRNRGSAAGSADRLGSRTGLSRLTSEALLSSSPYAISLNSVQSSPARGDRFLAAAATATAVDDANGETPNDDEEVVCVLQDLAAFVTPIPYVNTLFAEYASMLEMLCVATLRYIRYPEDEHHVRHARHTAEETLEFLLSFAVELSLLRRAVRTVAKMSGKSEREAGKDGADGSATRQAAQEGEGARAGGAAAVDDLLAEIRRLDGDGRGEEIDADFQCKACAWSRQAAQTKRYHLKTLILEMNTFANRRFRRYVAVLRRAPLVEPKLTDVETVEGMQKLLSTLGRR